MEAAKAAHGFLGNPPTDRRLVVDPVVELAITIVNAQECLRRRGTLYSNLGHSGGGKTSWRKHLWRCETSHAVQL